MFTISSKDVFRPDRIWPFRFAYQLLYFKDTFHIFNIVKDMSPDRSEKHFYIKEYFFLEQKKRPEEAFFCS
jgi:hypothetical protein